MLHLPDKILIQPLTVPVNATLSIPGSKSLTNRQLILAALAQGETTLKGALWSEDTELMVHCLQKLGFKLLVFLDPSNSSNRTITISGQGGKIPSAEADLYVGTAGTVARFLGAFCALGKGPYRLHGTDRMHERPMSELFHAIRSLGGKIEDRNGHLPATISGPINIGSIQVPSYDSSQFASALLLIGVSVDCPLTPYVEMTRNLLKEWKNPSKVREIELDASSASYFVALQRLHPGGNLELERYPSDQSSQIDRLIKEDRFWPPPEEVSRKKDLGDSILTLAIGAAGLKRTFRLVDAANLRKQECDRISALATELNKCGVPTRELPDGLVLSPASHFQRATIHTYQDHRIAMSFSILGALDVMKDGQPWITIENPSCVEKTFPNFYETLEELALQSYRNAKKTYRPIVLTPDGEPLFKSLFGIRDGEKKD